MQARTGHHNRCAAFAFRKLFRSAKYPTHSIHVWYIYLNLVVFLGNVGKYNIHGSYGLWKKIAKGDISSTSPILLMTSGRALLWMGCLGLGFTFLAGDEGPAVRRCCEVKDICDLVRSLAHVPKEGCRWVKLGEKINMF